MRIDFRPSPSLYPFESRWFESEVGPVHYLDEGAGRPILLLHGNPTWSFLYRKLIPRLRQGGLRCIALDYPGFGLSVHPDGYAYTLAAHTGIVASLIRHLQLEDVVVFGQDVGGPIGLGAAVQEPDRIAGLALGYTFAWAPTELFIRLVARAFSSRWGQRSIIEKGTFTRWVMRSLLMSRPTDEELRHYCDTHPTPESRRSIATLPRQLFVARRWLAQLEHDVRDRLGSKRSLLFSGGAREWPVGRPTRRFQRLLPDHRVIPLGRAGHYFQEDAPDLVAGAVLDRFAR